MYFCGVKVHTDALTTVEKSFRRGGRGGLTLYSERRLLDAMFLTLGNLANFKEIVTNLATVDVHGYVLYTLSKERAIGISAWASALLVQQSGQCESLRQWDEQMVQFPRFFII